MIGRVLADATNKSTDAIAFDANAGATVRRPGLLYNVSPITAAAGADEWRNTKGLIAITIDVRRMQHEDESDED